MTKEQEESIEYLKKHIKYFEEQIKFIEATDCDYYDEELELYQNRIKQFNTILSMLEEKEYKIKQLGKGQQALMQSRRKWKRRYYKMKDKNKDLQKSVEQIYDDYQDIGKMAFNYSDKIEEQDKIIDLMANHIATSDSDLCEYLDITTKCKYYAGDNGKTCDNCIKQYFENKAKELLNK